MNAKYFLLIVIGLILALFIHIYFNGLTSNMVNEDVGHGFMPSEHYANLSDFTFKVVKSIFLYILTLIGITFNILWTKSAKGNISDFWSLSTLRPILVSPVVFYTVYLFASKEPDTIVALLFSFQSGFFWQSVFTRQKSEVKNE